MKEINLYQIDDAMAKTMAPLLIKILEEKKKAFIYCPNKAKIKEIDDGLWVFGKVRFIAHTTIFEKDIEEISSWKRQPVLISDEEENKNEASYLVLTSACSDNFIKNFERVFYFYEEGEAAKIKEFAKKFAKVNSYKKVDGKSKIV